MPEDRGVGDLIRAEQLAFQGFHEARRTPWCRQSRQGSITQCTGTRLQGQREARAGRRATHRLTHARNRKSRLRRRSSGRGAQRVVGRGHRLISGFVTHRSLLGRAGIVSRNASDPEVGAFPDMSSKNRRSVSVSTAGVHNAPG